jgi:phosphate:Na+ symporter
MLNSIVANIVAGLGLFFSGLKMLDTNLRQATGRQLRTIIGHLTRTRWVSGLVGVAAGGLVPSSSGILFILVSLTTSGLTTVARAVPIITWRTSGVAP